jgi:hypothetical protein
MRQLIFVPLVCVCLAGPAAAQEPADTSRLPAALRIPRDQEIALARSAAPAVVAEAAEVWVLGDRGYERAKTGTNGYGCIVQRAMSGRSLIPRCDDPSGVEALFPVYQLIETMRAEGRTYGDVRKALDESYRSGRLKAPKYGGLSYMYSTDGFFAAGNGQRIAFTPHVMVYWPNCDVRLLGMSKREEMRGTGLSFIDYGSPECVLVVSTPPNTARRAEGQP